MKKNIFIIIILIFVSSCSLYFSPEPYEGTWKFDDDTDSIEQDYTVTSFLILETDAFEIRSFFEYQDGSMNTASILGTLSVDIIDFTMLVTQVIIDGVDVSDEFNIDGPNTGTLVVTGDTLTLTTDGSDTVETFTRVE